MSERAAALDAWLAHLACPVCGAGQSQHVRREAGAVRCERGHAFDIARQGYVNLGASQKDVRADTAAMVMAREAMHASGAFDGAARALNAAVAARDWGEGELRFADLAGGSGFYAARLLESLAAGGVGEPSAQARGLVLDLSTAALKRAVAAHERIAGVAADLTKGIPLRDGSVHALVNVFGPRNGAEMRRVLASDGACFVVSPSSHHLEQLVSELGMLQVADDKAERVERAMQGFTVQGRERCEERVEFGEAQLRNIIAMGPSAHHVNGEEIAARVAALLERAGKKTIEVTMSVDVTTFVPSDAASAAPKKMGARSSIPG